MLLACLKKSRLSVDDVLGIMGLMSGDEMDIGIDMEMGADSDIDSVDNEYIVLMKWWKVQAPIKAMTWWSTVMIL